MLLNLPYIDIGEQVASIALVDDIEISELDAIRGDIIVILIQPIEEVKLLLSVNVIEIESLRIIFEFISESAFPL